MVVMKPPELPLHAIRPAIGLLEAVDRGVIAAGDKTPSHRCIGDVGEGSPIDVGRGNFQDTAIIELLALAPNRNYCGSSLGPKWN